MSRSSDLDAFERAILRRIPLLKPMGVELRRWDGERLVLAAALDANRNHIDTAFGGSLAALATLCGAGALWLALRERGLAAQVLVQECHARFDRPVRGDFEATCARPDPAAEERLARSLARHGKGKIRLAASIREIGQRGPPALRFEGVFAALREEIRR